MSCCLFSDLCCVASITKQLDLRVWLKDWLNGMLRSFFAANSDQIVPRSRVFLLICTSLQRLISAGKLPVLSLLHACIWDSSKSL